MATDNEDRKAWFACFLAAITGVLAAHGGSGELQEAPSIAKTARMMADAAVQEARDRWPNEPMDPFLRIYGGR